MTAVAADQLNRDAAEEKAKLQRHFGRTDIFLFPVPSSLILAELGAAYTDEGGPYIWVRMAFGHLVGAVNNFFYWVTNPVWMGGTLVATAIGGLTVLTTGGADWSQPT